MVSNPPEGYQRVIPYIMYADAVAALDFLCKAFGFEERMRMPGPDGTIGHASPRDLPGRHGAIMCYVDDVDAHYQRAREAGAEIVAELEDKFYGDRMYAAADREGHQWYFATHVKDVSPEEMQGHAGG